MWYHRYGNNSKMKRALAHQSLVLLRNSVQLQWNFGP